MLVTVVMAYPLCCTGMNERQSGRKKVKTPSYVQSHNKDMVSTLSSGVEDLGSDAEVGRRRRYPKLGSEIHAVVVMSTKARHRIRPHSQSSWEGRLWSVGRTSIGAI